MGEALIETALGKKLRKRTSHILIDLTLFKL
jgi:hypothetical protein